MINNLGRECSLNWVILIILTLYTQPIWEVNIKIQAEKWSVPSFAQALSICL